MKKKAFIALAAIGVVVLVIFGVFSIAKKTTHENTITNTIVNAPGEAVGMANPASENCVAKGGKLTIAERAGFGQYGICYFDDNRQCEEWALFRGACPVGGLKVTGYMTPAATFCAITGGEYTITMLSGGDSEQGNCQLPGGKVCDVWEYYNGKCGN